MNSGLGLFSRLVENGSERGNFLATRHSASRHKPPRDSLNIGIARLPESGYYLSPGD